VTDRAVASNLPTPSQGWTGMTVRVLFGVIWTIDAVLKWLPGYRRDYISNLKSVAQGQPSWLHGWFHFWIRIQSHAPTFFAVRRTPLKTSVSSAPCDPH
jgi:thiosulfate dehydrogenase [quinone] large subunit